MMKLSKKQAGDTIVEVLIAMSVISLVLVGAYVSTNNNIASTQDAQERSQAVGLVQTEVEYLRKAGTISGANNCFVVSGSSAGMPSPGGGSPDQCTVTSDGVTAVAGAEPAYTLKITGNGAPSPVYAVSATWDSVTSGTAKDNLTMYYQP